MYSTPDSLNPTTSSLLISDRLSTITFVTKYKAKTNAKTTTNIIIKLLIIQLQKLE